MIYSVELTASLILAEAAVNTSEGNWIFSKEELGRKYGIEKADELIRVVETINSLYPNALLDDPFEHSSGGGLDLMLGGWMTFSYYENEGRKIPDEIFTVLNRLNKLNDAFLRYRQAKREFEACEKEILEAAA